ncbi:tripartite tricarboxylate transporter TctB family protein [Chachezhania antarctica]|uniref:tripartite tricarboxylate transporter TctB family protein n=1 Tax=Chachezhania antarctica TaxID=2340860 RepID=UPI000EB5C67F|nr:tripartite tricarboxylate transporter TctB family protein [Chachezhania antarctica]|tara:strand:+ start:4836 stop:5273 length:438 start_codon:yes stop_codon:yes gene_type:complete
MRRANVLSGAALAVFGLLMLIFVIPAQIDQGPPGMMSPRLVPSLMMGLTTVLAVLLCATNLRSVEDDDGPISRAELLALGKFGVLFAVAYAGYALIGPLAAGVVILLGGLLMLGERRPLYLVLLPVVVLGGTYLLFYRLLGTPIL